MDRSSGKRGAGGLVTPRKAHSVTAFKGAATETDHNSQSCNRIGCSGRIKCSQNARIGNLDKSNCSKASVCSSNGNEITGKSSRSSSIITSAKRSCIDSKGKMPSQSPFQSSVSSESEAPEVVSSSSNLSGHQLESISKTKEVSMTKAGSSGVSSNVGPLKTFRHKSNQNTPPASSVPSVSISSAPGPYNRSKGSRTSLRNLKCSSTSDVVLPSCSQLESEYVEKNTMKKRSLEGESSSSHGGRKITTPSPASTGISISASTRSTSSSGEDSGSSAPIWTRRSMNVNTRMRFSGRQNGRNSSSAREPVINYSHIQDNERPFSGSRSYRLSSSNGDSPSSRMPFASAEYDMEGIVEVLLALERIEQDEELTHEQFRALETSLFLSGLNLYDQHRQMRLDIDNMSYEELLALEDRMGTVSTALSEEAVSKCLRKSTYHAIPSNVQTTGLSEDGDDIKCSICQEEYVDGDEIGKLVECEHGYHETCINQWLKLKNWCPICKASAEPSQS
ncbi:hypothetical protein ACS0TY_012090 [Phlomoides rotata]